MQRLGSNEIFVRAYWLIVAILIGIPSAAFAQAPQFSISFPAERSAQPLDGRMLLLLSTDPSEEPRMQIDDTPKTQMVFGVTVDGLKTRRSGGS